MKATNKSYKKDGKRDSKLNIVKPDFWDVISNYLGQNVTLQLKKLASSNV